VDREQHSCLIAAAPASSYETIVGKVGVSPDSVQVFGGTLSTGLPTVSFSVAQ